MGEGASKTRIVYQVNLNFRTVNPYIDALINSGLIGVLNDRAIHYRTTDKGEDMLGMIKEVDAMVPLAGL